MPNSVSSIISSYIKKSVRRSVVLLISRRSNLTARILKGGVKIPFLYIYYRRLLKRCVVSQESISYNLYIARNAYNYNIRLS